MVVLSTRARRARIRPPGSSSRRRDKVSRAPELLDASSPPLPVVVMDDANLLRAVADLRWRMDELMGPGNRSVVVDITGLSHLSSRSLAALLWAARRCRSRGGQVQLRGANRRCRDLLARTGLTAVLAVDQPETTEFATTDRSDRSPVPAQEARR